jgi:uncharacterized BrkB/YihY/UPF0761 family membrane protein
MNETNKSKQDAYLKKVRKRGHKQQLISVFLSVITVIVIISIISLFVGSG